jgi:hypothetical protein
VYAAAAVASGTAPLDAAPDRRRRGDDRGDVIRNRPIEVHRPLPHDGGSRSDGHAGQLSNSSGSVLDPIVAIRLEITLLPDETVSVDYITGMAETRDSAVELIDKYRDRHLADRVFDMAWTHGQVVLRQLNASEADAQLFGRLAGSIVYANAALRANAATLKKNRRGSPACGDTASPATCRSSCSASATPRTFISSGNSSRRTRSGGSRGWGSIWSSGMRARKGIGKSCKT